MAEAADNKVPATKAKPARKATASKPATARKPAAKKTAVKKAPAKNAAPKAAAAKKTTTRKSAAAKPAAKATPKKPNINSAQAEADKQQAAEAPKSEQPTKESVAEAPDASKASDETKDHPVFDSDKLIAELKEKDWGTIAVRAFFMVLFGFLANLALMATFMLALIQFIMMVGTGKPNNLITSIISRLATYIGQALNFLSFKTENRPFPMEMDIPGDD